MKIELESHPQKGSATLTITELNEESSLAAGERIKQIIDLLSTIIEFDDCLENLPEDDFKSRAYGCIALDLKYQSSLSLAKQRAETCLAVARGEESIRQHGFPELDA